jgi:hypothetical protein
MFKHVLFCLVVFAGFLFLMFCSQACVVSGEPAPEQETSAVTGAAGVTGSPFACRAGTYEAGARTWTTECDRQIGTKPIHNPIVLACNGYVTRAAADQYVGSETPCRATRDLQVWCCYAPGETPEDYP